MKFEWDESKNQMNIHKHGFDFVDACLVFASPLLEKLDTREDYGEDRWIGLGMLAGRIVVLIYAQPDAETIRVISLRKANWNEQKAFEKAITDRLGED